MGPENNNIENDSGYKMFLDERFARIFEKLDGITDALSTKASASYVGELATKLDILASTHNTCPMHQIKPDVEQLKKDRDVLMDVTEDIRFYEKRPKQLKMMVAGAVLLGLLWVMTLIPSWIIIKKYSTDLKKEKTHTEIPK